MGEFRTVCRVGDVAEGEAKAFAINGKLIAVFCQGGQYFAIDDVCPHMGASLSEGFVEEGVVTCPWHGWRFRLCDGAWADSPRVKTGWYPVRVENNEIQVQVNGSGANQGP
jgi:nitrite reductase (NADH) small subunit